LSGFNVLKYDYNNKNLIYKKEISFDLINKHLDDKSQINPRDFHKYNLAQFHDFIKSNNILDMENQGLRLSFLPNYGAWNGIKVTMLRTRINKSGDLVQIDKFFYKNNINQFLGYDLIPEKSIEVLKDNDSNYKQVPLDFINSFQGKNDPDLTVFKTFYKRDFNIVIFAREKDGEIKAFKLEK